MLSGSSYSDYIKNCQSFNARIAAERRHRLPFLDAQTGIAQSPSYLWRDKKDRYESPDPSVAFVYASPQRWRRRKSNFNIYSTDVRWSVKTERVESGEGNNDGEGDVSTSNGTFGIVGNPITTRSGAATGGNANDSMNNAGYTRNSGDTSTANTETKNTQDQTWYDDLSDPQLDDFEDHSDGEDYEETYVKKKSKKKKTNSSQGDRKPSRRPNDIPDSEKPFSCKHCGAKYKTKPGLHYHLTHAHVNEFNDQKDRVKAEVAAAAAAAAAAMSSAASVNTQSQPAAVAPADSASTGGTSVQSAPSVQSNRQVENSETRPLGKFRGEPNQYCDFCLGDASENKKTNSPEELINCSDCGRSGHPTCLNFTANMIISTKKYGWQCIECKSCAMCGTSENDDQLLFCDDCDRGFHMYCLRPPLSAPPEGNWSCHLCVVEFGPNASRPASVAAVATGQQ